MVLTRLRGRMPLLVFILVVVCLGMVAFACACFDGDPGLVGERGSATPLPALVELWPLLLLGAFSVGLLAVVAPVRRARASPELLAGVVALAASSGRETPASSDGGPYRGSEPQGRYLLPELDLPRYDGGPLSAKLG